MSVLLLVPHYLADCGFVIFPEVWVSYASFLVSLAAQKLVSLIRPHWFIFAFISVALGD